MFDPYHKWLGILPKDQPPNHYRLLGLERFESDLDVIEGAADRAMGFIRQYQSGEHGAVATKLLNEIAAARLCLLKPDTKSQYDAKLRKESPAPETPKTTREDNDPFGSDDELAALMNAPTEVIRLPKRSSKSKRKKKKSGNGLLIGGGIVAGIGVLLVVMSMSSNSRSTIGQSDIVESKSTTSSKDTPSASSSTPAPKKFSLVESTLVVDPSGPSVDLIQPIDLTRDLYTGDWKREGFSLVGGKQSTVYFPTRMPDDYQLKFRVKRLEDNGAILIGFVMEGRQGVISFDLYQKFSGIWLDGRDPRDNCTTRDRSLLKKDQSSEIIVTVHPGHVHSSVNGQAVVDWHGEARRLSTNSDFEPPFRETPYCRVAEAKFEIESATMIPLKLEPEPPKPPKFDSVVDLMPLLETDPSRDRGIWALNKNVLHSPATGVSMFPLPIRVPEEYKLSVIAELQEDVQDPNQVLVIGLVAGKSLCSIALRNNDCMGLERIDGVRWNANETRLGGTFITKGKPVKIDCTVTKQAIRMELDGRTMIHWTGDLRRLIPQGDWATSDARKLFFGTTVHFKLSDITVGPPAGPPGLQTHPPFEIGKPVDLLAMIDPARDGYEGKWEKEGTIIRVMGDYRNAKLAIPCEMPAEYKLTMQVAREAGGNSDKEGIAIILPVDSCSMYVPLEATAPEAPKQELVIFVRKTGVKVVKKDKPIIDWPGNLNRFSQPQWNALSGRVAVISGQTRFRFEKLEIESLEPSPFPPVAKLGEDGNLLSIIEPLRDSRRGAWKKDAEGLLNPAGQLIRLSVPVKPPERYAITADIERRQGGGPIQLGLIAGTSPCSVMIDSFLPEYETHLSGLERLDDKLIDDNLNLTYRSFPDSVLPKGKRIKVKCLVQPDAILVYCDNKEIVRWHGDPRRLSSETFYVPPTEFASDRSHLWLSTSDSEFRIRDYRMTPLSKEDSEKMPSSVSSVFPVVAESDKPKRTYSPGQFPAFVNEVLPGFATTASDRGLAILRNFRGRSNVLRAHPVSPTVPCILTGAFPIPEGKKTKLVMDVTHHMFGDWQLIVKANGEQLLKEDVGPKTCKDGRTSSHPGWGVFEVDLTKFAGKTAKLELLCVATDWKWEFAYWSGVRFVSTNKP